MHNQSDVWNNLLEAIAVNQRPGSLKNARTTGTEPENYPLLLRAAALIYSRRNGLRDTARFGASNSQTLRKHKMAANHHRKARLRQKPAYIARLRSRT
jgi:hypothetical protein